MFSVNRFSRRARLRFTGTMRALRTRVNVQLSFAGSDLDRENTGSANVLRDAHITWQFLGGRWRAGRNVVVDFLPLGAFTNGGDYSEGDQAREPSIMLSLAGAVSRNDRAVRTGR